MHFVRKYLFRGRHSQICKEDDGPSISACPTHTIDVRRDKREREMFYLTTHSTHFIYGYMASDIWLRTILIVRKETRCRHIGYSYRLAARVLLYAPSHRQDSTYHGLCYTSRGALAGTRNSFVRIESLMPTNVKICELINYACQLWIEHPVFVPHC